MEKPKRRGGTIVRVLLSAGAVVAVAVFGYRQRHLFVGFGSAVANARWYWILFAFVAEILSIVPLAEAERVVLRTAGVNAPLGEMIAVTFASNAIASSLPGGVAVAEGYAYKRYRHFGAAEAEAAWAELASGAIAFSALAGLALTGAVIDARRAGPIVIPLLGFVFAGSLGSVEVFRRPELIVRGVDWIERRVGGRLGRVVEQRTKRIQVLVEDLDDVDPSLNTWAWAFALSEFNWLLDAVCLGFLFLALRASIPSAAILLAFAGTKVLSSIGVTPGGLGIVEGGMVATFVAYGVPGADAAAVALVYRGLTLIGLVGFGWAMVAVLSAEGRHPHRHVTGAQ
jgi:uncharacterized protein (TIRG00374 family)